MTYPCTADFSAMTPAPGGRFCDTCEKVVHDLSAMSEGDARSLLGSLPAERVCIRYVYDADRRVVFGGVPANARVVPAHALTARLRRTLKAAMVAAPLLIEACGGADLHDVEPTDAGADADGGGHGGTGGSAGHAAASDAGVTEDADAEVDGSASGGSGG